MRTLNRVVTALAAVVGYVALILAITAARETRESNAFHDAPEQHAAFVAALDRGDVEGAREVDRWFSTHTPSSSSSSTSISLATDAAVYGDLDFARRYVNDGFSGGEMKRAEILQLAMLQPKIAILDETDSGLDADAVRLASQSIAEIGREKMGLLIITHHDKLLEHNPPDFTHVILGGRIVETGGVELANELHTQGYDRIRAAYPDAEAANRKMVEKEEAVLT